MQSRKHKLIKRTCFQLLSTHLYCVAQAIDLRLWDVQIQAAVKDLLCTTLHKHLSAYLGKSKLIALARIAFVFLQKRLEETPSINSRPRFEDAAKHLIGVIVDTLVDTQAEGGASNAVAAWKADFAASSAKLYCSLRSEIMSGRDNLSETKENLVTTFAVYECN